jgi:hypothetical protein
MSLFAYLRMVLWSFFGIKRNASAAEELGRMNPLGLLGLPLQCSQSWALRSWAWLILSSVFCSESEQAE